MVILKNQNIHLMNIETIKIYWELNQAYLKNGTHDPERTQHPRPYEDPGPYENLGLYEDPGLYDNPEPYKDLGP